MVLAPLVRLGMDLAVGGAVPEPSTWAMTLLGFAGHRRARAGSAALAALSLLIDARPSTDEDGAARAPRERQAKKAGSSRRASHGPQTVAVAPVALDAGLRLRVVVSIVPLKRG